MVRTVSYTLAFSTLLAVQSASAAVISLKTEADAHIRGDTASSITYGTQDKVEIASRTGQYNRVGLFRFDLGTSIPAGEVVTQAALRLSLLDSGYLIGSGELVARIAVYGVINGDADWTESGVTWDNSGFGRDTVPPVNGAKALHLGTVNVDFRTLSGGDSISLSTKKMAEFVNWAAGLQANFYGTGIEADLSPTFLIALHEPDPDFPGFSVVSRETGGMPATRLATLELTTASPAPASQGEIAALFGQSSEDPGLFLGSEYPGGSVDAGAGLSNALDGLDISTNTDALYALDDIHPTHADTSLAGNYTSLTNNAEFLFVTRVADLDSGTSGETAALGLACGLDDSASPAGYAGRLVRDPSGTSRLDIVSITGASVSSVLASSAPFTLSAGDFPLYLALRAREQGGAVELNVRLVADSVVFGTGDDLDRYDLRTVFANGATLATVKSTQPAWTDRRLGILINDNADSEASNPALATVTLSSLFAGKETATQYINSSFRVRPFSSGAFEVRDLAASSREDFTADFLVSSFNGASSFPKYTLDSVTEVRGGSGSTGLGYQVPKFDPPGATASTNFWANFDTVQSLAPVATLTLPSHQQWYFADDRRLRLEARLLPDSNGLEPRVEFSWIALEDAWLSVGYDGIAKRDLGFLNWLNQGLIWNDLRYPNSAYSSTESQMPLGGIFMGVGNTALGQIAVTEDMILDQVPKMENSRFVGLLRTHDAKAKPMLFFPTPSIDAAYHGTGKRSTYSVQLLARAMPDPGDLVEVVTKDLLGFEDYRTNLDISMNEMMDNLDDHLLDGTYGGWNDRGKGWDGRRDNSGRYRQQSPALMLAYSLARDNLALLEQRAVPSIEAALSHKNLNIRIFNNALSSEQYDSSNGMGGPSSALREELATISMLTGNRNLWIAERALNNIETTFQPPVSPSTLQIFNNGRTKLDEMLSYYRLTEDSNQLAKAVATGEAYIEARIDTMQTDWADSRSTFWTEIGPNWEDVFELYLETGNPDHLQAAYDGAREYLQFVLFYPPVRDEEVSVNPGDAVSGSWGTNLATAGVQPHWLMSEVGLIPEAASTSAGHRGIFVIPNAARLLRLAFYTSDDFLREVARSMVIGRYRNYPGYHINREYTDLYQSATYPKRGYASYLYNSVHYHHGMMMAQMLLDYQVSDAFLRSEAAISFPARYCDTGFYFQYNLYGDRPGVIYDWEGIQLWTPSALLTSTSSQLNYIAGYDGSAVYLVLMNQSFSEVNATVTLNALRTSFGAAHSVAVRRDNAPETADTMTNGSIDVTVSAQGITVLRLDGVAPILEMQDTVLSQGMVLGPESYHLEDLGTFKVVDSGAYQIGHVKRAYFWLEAGTDIIDSARLTYDTGVRSETLIDNDYPFEFELDLKYNEDYVDSTVTLWNDGAQQASTTNYRLEFLNSPAAFAAEFNDWLIAQGSTPRDAEAIVPELTLDASATVRCRFRLLTSSTSGEGSSVGFLFNAGEVAQTTSGFIARIERVPGVGNSLVIDSLVNGKRGTELARTASSFSLAFSDILFMELILNENGGNTDVTLNLIEDNEIPGSGASSVRLADPAFATANLKATLSASVSGDIFGLAGFYFEDNSSGEPSNPAEGSVQLTGIYLDSPGVSGSPLHFDFADTGTDPDEYFGTRLPGNYDSLAPPAVVAIANTSGEDALRPSTTGATWYLLDDPNITKEDAGHSGGGLTGDVNANGIADFAEFFHGVDSVSGYNQVGPALSRSGNLFEFAFRRAATAVDTYFDYTIQESTDMSTWTTIPANRVSTFTEAFGGETTIRVEGLDTTLAPQRFLRLNYEFTRP